ncbi:uncharacterized protein CLUP02_10010 [Colletotrichum lupini]|uniref:Secreted protein n=1 Tax=Colletotrichum lupini TaxID=145971 RepID=A0A9Q8SWJ4_9PEZI|nr:uncharacterized protein CLUP02_10010 [Colletotrichum lupini]UQC84513.1 hypothetical protein CLUP02_10010 [Colletotrichum lupini]
MGGEGFLFLLCFVYVVCPGRERHDTFGPHTHTLHPHRIDAHIYSLFLPGSDLWCCGGVSLPSRISVPTPIVRRTPPTIPPKVGVARRVFHCPTKKGSWRIHMYTGIYCINHTNLCAVQHFASCMTVIHDVNRNSDYGVLSSFPCK